MEGVATAPAGASRVSKGSTSYLPSQCVPQMFDGVEIGTLCRPIKEIYLIPSHPVFRVFG